MVCQLEFLIKESKLVALLEFKNGELPAELRSVQLGENNHDVDGAISNLLDLTH